MPAPFLLLVIFVIVDFKGLGLMLVNLVMLSCLIGCCYCPCSLDELMAKGRT